MGIGDPTLPVDDGTEANNPVPRSGDDHVKGVDDRLGTLERAGNNQLAYAVRFLYNFLGLPYPPP